MGDSWKLYYFEIFYEQIKKLADDVKKLKEKDPAGYKNHKKTKLLAKVWHVINDQIAQDPQNRIFNLGDMLPKEYRHYKRVKSGLPARYRLFFRFKKEDRKIVIIWMNDEFSLRKHGSKTDVYTIFISMLEQKTIPSDWKSLLSQTVTQEEKT